jgi:multiple sugar transport system ATP-binding protein
LPGKISIIEHLGNSTILYVDTPAGQLTVEGAGNLQVAASDNVGLTIDAGQARLFGADGVAL